MSPQPHRLGPAMKLPGIRWARAYLAAADKSSVTADPARMTEIRFMIPPSDCANRGAECPAVSFLNIERRTVLRQ